MENDFRKSRAIRAGSPLGEHIRYCRIQQQQMQNSINDLKAALFALASEMNVRR